MHQVEKDYQTKNWRVYVIRSCDNQNPPLSDLNNIEEVYVTADGVFISEEAKMVVCSTEDAIFGEACRMKDVNPEWQPEFLLFDYEMLAAEAITDGKNYVPMDIGVLTEEWRGHKSGALVMSFPTHCGVKTPIDEIGFTWMVEVTE